jgi:nicotinamide/nicotinate riboside kinase
MHPEWDVPDWDTPAGAIEWPHFIALLRKFKSAGMMLLDPTRQDHFTMRQDIQMLNEIERCYRDSFAQLELDMQKEGVRIIWGLVDGFLLYWDKVKCNAA